MKSPFDSKWILSVGIPIVRSYGGNLTLRALHYRLVANGMTNDLAHYKKVVNTMIKARWDGLIGFNAFLDHERQTLGHTHWKPTDVDSASEQAKTQIRLWATSYRKNRWENQPNYVEVFIEKKALQGVFENPCYNWGVALNPCKGYPSLTYLNDATNRFYEAYEAGKNPVILYFGDYDPSGEDIPRSIQENLEKLGVWVDLKRIALKEHQVIDWNLPPAPTKLTDSRSRNWDGLGQVELDAVEPNQLVDLVDRAISNEFIDQLYKDLKDQEAEEREEFKAILKRDFETLLD